MSQNGDRVLIVFGVFRFFILAMVTMIIIFVIQKTAKTHLVVMFVAMVMVVMVLVAMGFSTSFLMRFSFLVMFHAMLHIEFTPSMVLLVFIFTSLVFLVVQTITPSVFFVAV